MERSLRIEAVRRPPRVATVVLAGLVGVFAGLCLSACAGTTTPFDDVTGRRQGGDARMPSVPIPNATAGDAAARGEAGAGGPGVAAPPASQEQLRALARSRLQAAERAWDQAVRIEPANPSAAARLFETVVTRYPEYERAAEARFRQGKALYEGREYTDAIDALKKYMLIAPVNPHLAEVEEMLYESGRRTINRGKGPFGLFGSDAAGIAALEFVAETFPAGNYPDDALLALGNYYGHDEDYQTASLHFRELLIRYPDSEWSFRARIALADTYLARDAGTPYNAGFVMLDPREPVPAELAIQAGPVKQGVMLALEEYETFLARMDADPARRAEYADEIAYARRRAQEARERIASKLLDRADWYQRRGDMTGAITYWRLASGWTTTSAGRAAAARLGAALPGPGSAPARVTPTPSRGASVSGARPPVASPPTVVPSRPPVPPPPPPPDLYPATPGAS